MYVQAGIVFFDKKHLVDKAIKFPLTLSENAKKPLVIASYFAVTLVYLNSSLNPLLYCWKIKEVRHSVMEILRNFGFR